MLSSFAAAQGGVPDVFVWSRLYYSFHRSNHNGSTLTMIGLHLFKKIFHFERCLIAFYIVLAKYFKEASFSIIRVILNLSMYDVIIALHF